ncbi:hypothetical protein RJ639_037539 [Escallonia herrerae]|uniref:Uncharacterized protein n=1 Tax=Escallonia herrerae TaxID=1293975 RepID=A0AA89B7N1_9ASTE|nr:hypothetical protein RJ639_037539 [Escallonia herrerae]
MVIFSRGFAKLLGGRECKGYCKLNKTDTRKPVRGVVPVYVGEEGSKYDVPIEYFSSLRIKELLERYEEELEASKPLSLPCPEKDFETMVIIPKVFTKMLGSKGCKGYSKLNLTNIRKPVRGVVPVYVGEEGSKFDVRIEYFSSFRMKELLERYEEELEASKPLSLPCSEKDFETVIHLVKTEIEGKKKRKK